MSDPTSLILVTSTVAAVVSIITLWAVVNVAKCCKKTQMILMKRGGIDDQ